MKLTPRGVTKQMIIHGCTWTSGAAFCGLCFGIISPFIGSILTAIAWFTGPEWHGFSIQRYGTVLLFLTIPLLIFGAHCLDLMDKQDEEASNSRKNSIKANGFRIEEGNSNDLVRD